MNTSEKVLNGIKKALTEGKATVKLSKEKAEQDVNEASHVQQIPLEDGRVKLLTQDQRLNLQLKQGMF